MKKLYLLIFSCILLVSANAVSALEIKTPTQVQVEIIESTTQKISRLKSAYGEDNFNYCYKYYNYCGNSSASWAIDACWKNIEYCANERHSRDLRYENIESALNTQTEQKSGTVADLGCPSPMIKVNGSCVDYCKHNFGSHSYSQRKEDFWTWECLCEAGYQMNQEKTLCVVTHNSNDAQNNVAKVVSPGIKAENNEVATDSAPVIDDNTTTTNDIEPKQDNVAKGNALKEIWQKGLLNWIIDNIFRLFSNK